MGSPLSDALHSAAGPCCASASTSARLLWPLRALARLITFLLLGLIAFYQRVISPGLRPRCRFVPSCSEYAALALRKHGLLKGLGKTIWRLARCQPLCKGGYDEP